MTYGHRKIKDMAESLLPSTKRKKARETRKAIHRRDRRAYRQDPENYERRSLDQKRDIEIQEMMWERRGADKLSIVRWAQKVTANIDDPVERYLHLKKMLPDNLIGRHALGHCENYGYGDGLEILAPGNNRFEYYGHWKTENERRERAAEEARQRCVDELRLVVATGGLKALNRAIKRAHHKAVYYETYYVDAEGRPLRGFNTGAIQKVRSIEGHRIYNQKKREYTMVPCNCAPRTLKGDHDLDAFVEEVLGKHFFGDYPRGRYENPSHPEWSRAVRNFLKDLNP